MKKHYLISLIFVLVFSASYSQIVTVETAKQLAKNIYYERANIEKPVAYKDITFDSEFTITDNDQPVFYIYNVSQNAGFVIISAERRTVPVLFYSFEGNYSPEIQNENFEYWMNLYKKQISFARSQNIPNNNEIEQYWNYYSAAPVVLSKDIEAVSPLLTTNWDQGCYYNASCPSKIGGDCGKCYTGCVATAMAMVMKYHSYPAQGYSSHSYAHTITNGFSNNFGTLTANFGTTTYNWTSMPNSVTSTNSSVATLMYHCGVAVEMDYDVSGSGAYLYNVTGALQSYFIYAAEYTYRDINTDAAWTLLIKESLDQSRPVIYGGGDATFGGHAFVCDGYQNSGTYSNMFHFNWGWSGYYNGYAYLSDVAPGSGDHFNSSQEIVYNIYPNPATTPVANFTANKTTLAANDFVYFVNSSTNGPTSYLWSVSPSAGTSFYSGSTAASVNPKIKFTIPGYYTISLTATNSAGSDTETKNNYIYVYSTAGIDDKDLLKNILIYPNPAKDIVTIETGIIPSTKINLKIYNTLGDEILDGINSSTTENNMITMNLSSLKKGIYYIKLITDEQTATKKIILY